MVDVVDGRAASLPPSSSSAPTEAAETEGDEFVERLADRSVKYTGRVAVGLPPQEFDVVFDTGSEIFWLPGYGAHYSIPGRVWDFAMYAHTYDVNRSSTAQRTGRPFQLNYAVGMAEGEQVADFLTVGWEGRGLLEHFEI